MATSTVTQLVAPTELTTTLTTLLYTVPTGKTVVVKEIWVSNTDTVARTTTVYFGTGTAVANTFLPAVSIAANTTMLITLSTVLIAGNLIKGGASVNSKLAIGISGVVVA